MNEKAWCLFHKYEVNEKGKIKNIQSGRTLTRTAKGYTIGYYINKKFYSLKQLRVNLVEKQKVSCPF